MKVKIRGTAKDKIKGIVKDVLLSIILLAAATGIGYLFNYLGLQETNIVITYILSVLLISRFTSGYVYGILATIFSLILFNWFFTDPRFSLNVSDPTYGITFVIMTFTAILTSTLTTKVKKSAIEASQRESENHALYQMANLFSDADNIGDVGSIVVKTVSEILSSDVGIICYDENGKIENSFIQQKGKEQIRRELNNISELQMRIENLHSPFDIDDEYYNYPIYSRSVPMAILRIPKETAENLSEEKSRMVYAIIENTALALERLKSIRAHEKSREQAIQEHYRGNLLRSISHDIRTPLSGIMGSVEMLIDMTDKDDPRYSIEKGVYQDADWLHSLVENVLNLTKLHDGHLNIEKKPEAVEEVVSSSIFVIEKRFPDRNVKVSSPDEFIMAEMDAKLISQVLVNLIDNAVKHTEKDKEIEVSFCLDGDNVKFSVADRGCGIPEKDMPKIFEMFYTTWRKSSDSQRGIGLGLAICQSIVEAHGGKIMAENREGGGSEFTFTLPLKGDKNEGNERDNSDC